VDRALDLAARLPEGLPRLFIELRPPSHPPSSDVLAAGKEEEEEEEEEEENSPSVEGVRAACATRPLHACIVLTAPGPSATAAAAAVAAYDALAHEVVAICHRRFGSGGGGGPGGGGGRRGGRSWRGTLVGAIGESLLEKVRVSMEDPAVVLVAAVVFGVAAVGLTTLAARGGGWGMRGEGARKG
jgi:hypothetical protein